jgi:hypothetical protein
VLLLELITPLLLVVVAHKIQMVIIQYFHQLPLLAAVKVEFLIQQVLMAAQVGEVEPITPVELQPVVLEILLM